MNNTLFCLFALSLLLIFQGCRPGQGREEKPAQTGQPGQPGEPGQTEQPGELELLGQTEQPGQTGQKRVGQPPLSYGEIRYAEGFQIDHFEDYTKVTIHNPWVKNQEPYEVYYLFREGAAGKINNLPGLPEHAVKLKVPLTSLVVNSFSYFGFLTLLEELDIVTGVSDGFRIYNPQVINRLGTGQIVDLGDPFNPDIEKTMALKPDAIINSAFAQQDSYSERLSRVGFPIIYSLEWMEPSPLARAEWIKLIAAFLDKSEIGDSIFNLVEQQYLDIKQKTSTISNRHTVMAGDNFQGTWYMPAGKSYNATLFRDAGLSYFYEENNDHGSIGLDIESVLTQFSKADYWFGCEAGSYGELAKIDTKYQLLEPVKKRQVYNNHNRITRNGGNDYFESAIAHPHLLLSDLVKAVYPDLLPGYSFTYIKPLH